jgi:hypothetical protein
MPFLLPAIWALVEHVGGFALDAVTKTGLGAKIATVASSSSWGKDIVSVLGSLGTTIDDTKKQELINQLQSLHDQSLVDIEEDKSSHGFQANWRPFVAWGMSLTVVLHCFITETINILHVVGVDIAQIQPMDTITFSLMAGLLGLYMGAHTLEKIKDVD